MHVKQAIKILLPREYISHSHQKRHWASKYLPGKEPLNPKHDIFKYCDVALKIVQKGKNKFHIGRVEAIQSTKDGSEITSFQTKGKVPVQVRCSLYNHEGGGVYGVRDDVILTNWKSSSSIIGKIVLEPIPGQRFKYTLHPSSKGYLSKLGTVAADCSEDDSSSLVIEDDNHSDNSSELDDDEFFEVEDVLDRLLSKSVSKGTDPKRTCGFHLHFLIDRYNFNPRQHLDVKGSTISIRKMPCRSRRRRRGLPRANQRNGIRNRKSPSKARRRLKSEMRSKKKNSRQVARKRSQSVHQIKERKLWRKGQPH